MPATRRPDASGSAWRARGLALAVLGAAVAAMLTLPPHSGQNPDVCAPGALVVRAGNHPVSAAEEAPSALADLAHAHPDTHDCR